MVTIEELKDILYQEEWNDIERRQTDPNGNIKQREDREQYYVDNLTLDSRSASVVGKEQGEHYWQFAPQMQEYREELNDIENMFNQFAVGFMLFFLGIALWFITKIESSY
jgi:hypothetical protein|tara:strand:- start:593 stop:922 length:330 start_codon:yes stop_codon:yes gene_type:complete